MKAWKRRAAGVGLALLVMLLGVALGGSVAAAEEAATAVADDPAGEAPSAANPAAIAALPAVWHDGLVTQLSIGAKVAEDGQQDTAMAVALSRQLNDRVLVRGVLSHALQKDQTVVAGSVILKW